MLSLQEKLTPKCPKNTLTINTKKSELIRLLKWKMTPNLSTKFTLEIRKKKVDALIYDTLPGKFDYYIIVSSIFGYFFL